MPVVDGEIYRRPKQSVLLRFVRPFCRIHLSFRSTGQEQRLLARGTGTARDLFGVYLDGSRASTDIMTKMDDVWGRD